MEHMVGGRGKFALPLDINLASGRCGVEWGVLYHGVVEAIVVEH